MGPEGFEPPTGSFDARDLQIDRSTWTQRERAPLDEPLIA
jgi:hypothetical protein